MREFSPRFWLRLFLGTASIVGLVVIAILMAEESPSRTESALLNFLLFLFSVSASWAFSKMYSETSASENLRDYGVQVARGVMILQSQIRTLTQWISEKRQELPTELVNTAVDAHFEHVEEMLHSFQAQSEATLRGIASVIGDAFKQYEETIRQINTIRQKEAEERGKIISDATSADSLTNLDISNQFGDQLFALEQRTNQKIAQLAQQTSLPIDIPRLDRISKLRCPVCSIQNTITISSDPGSTRKINCISCGSTYNVHVDSSGNLFTRVYW